MMHKDSVINQRHSRESGTRRQGAEANDGEAVGLRGRSRA